VIYSDSDMYTDIDIAVYSESGCYIGRYGYSGSDRYDIRVVWS